MGRIIRTLLGSIVTKLALVLFIMGAITGVAVMVASLVFGDTVSGLHRMSNEKLPRMTQSSTLIINSNALKDGIAAILIATSKEELTALSSEIDAQLQSLDEHVAESPSDMRALLEPQILTLRTDTEILRQARAAEFQSVAEVNTTIRRMESLADQISLKVGEMTDDAYSSVVVGVEETVATVNGTLKHIINVDVEGLHLVQQVRSEINLLSGLALAHAETSDPTLDEIIRKLGESSLSRLNETLETITAAKDLKIDVEMLSDSAKLFAKTLRDNNFMANLNRGDVLGTRQKVDALLTSFIDDLLFDLLFNSTDATKTNSETISGLLGNQVEALRSLSALETSLLRVLVNANGILAARDMPTLIIADEKLKAATASLSKFTKNAPPKVIDALADILRIATGENGLTAQQKAVFDNHTAAIKAAHAVTKSVLNTADLASAIGTSSATDIIRSAVELDEKASAAQRMMVAIAVVSLIAFVTALLLSYFVVIRPILALCHTTERLASGDYAEVTGFKHQSSEIRRMATALQVFRDSLVEKLELEREDAARKKHQAREQQAAEAERVARETAELERVAAEEKALAAREAREAAERDALRVAAEQERLQRMKEQESVVSALAVGLNKLSDGNLDAEIVEQFPGTYDKLRRDFNRAIANLSSLIGEMAVEGHAIDISLAELSTAAESLAKRTERSAAQLEETATAIDNLTGSVSSAAEDAETANSSATNASQRAENGRQVIDKAIAAMSMIETSSSEINKVTELINDIARQTNLLALNASVEAARAGEAGRGFAVVATEVRELARRSAEASKEINVLLDQSTQNVALGSDLVSKTGDALESILISVTETNDMVVRITESSRHQAASIGEINRAVASLDKATQENATMFEETSSLATALSGSSSNLAEAIGQFKVPGRPETSRRKDHARSAPEIRDPATHREPGRTPVTVHHAGGPRSTAIREWSDV